MESNKNGTRYYHYNVWEDVKNAPYDYKRNGLAQHILSNVIVKSKNTTLQAILNKVNVFDNPKPISLLKYLLQNTNKKSIILDRPINHVGNFVMTIKLSSKVKAQLNVEVVASETIKEVYEETTTEEA